MKPDLLYNMDPFKPNDSYLTKLFPRKVSYLHFKTSTIDSDRLFQAPLRCTLLGNQHPRQLTVQTAYKLPVNCHEINGCSAVETWYTVNHHRGKHTHFIVYEHKQLSKSQ